MIYKYMFITKSLVLIRNSQAIISPIKNHKPLLNPSLSPKRIVAIRYSQHSRTQATAIICSLGKQTVARNSDLVAIFQLDHKVRQCLVARVKVITPAVVPLRIGDLAPVEIGNVAADATATSAGVKHNLELMGFESAIVVSGPDSLDFDSPKTTCRSDVAIGNVSRVLGVIYVAKVELPAVVGGSEVNSPQRLY